MQRIVAGASRVDVVALNVDFDGDGFGADPGLTSLSIPTSVFDWITRGSGD